MGPTLKEFQTELAKGQSLFLDTARHGSSVTVKMERNLVWLDLLIWKFCSLEDIVRKYAAQRDGFSSEEAPATASSQQFPKKRLKWKSIACM